MSWGGGWHKRHEPETAKKVAEAFYAGKARKRSNCESWCNEITGEWIYSLEGHAIAFRRDPVTDTTRALEGQPIPKSIETFSFAGWPTDMTCRHLRALGIDAQLLTDYEVGPKGGRGRAVKVPLMNGKAVSNSGRYSREDLAALPDYVPMWSWQRRAEQLAGTYAARAAAAAEALRVQPQLELA